MLNISIFDIYAKSYNFTTFALVQFNEITRWCYGILKNRLVEQNALLVEQFVKNIEHLDVTGIPAPHIPIVGMNYDIAKYKFVNQNGEYTWM